MPQQKKRRQHKKTLVMKFGGTSVGSPEAIKQAAEIVKDHSKEWDQLVVVVSAMSGVTNALISCAQAAVSGEEKTYQGIITELRSRHENVINSLLTRGEDRMQLESTLDEFFNELTAFCSSIHIMGEVTPRGMDVITSFGERINARVISSLLEEKEVKSQAVDATDLIVTDDTFQNASPLMDATRTQVSTVLLPLLEKGVTPVVTGFISANEDGITTTLGRGGSDYTASILGDCLDASEVWTWTDVDGVMTADPRSVPDALVIPELSYSEVSEMAYFGAKVLHPKTIRPIIEREIPLWVKNTFNPKHPGTVITKSTNRPAGKITAITAIRDLSLVTVEGRGMLGVPGIAARTFSAVAAQGASVLMISQSSSEQSICFVVPTETVPRVIQSIEAEMALELARKDIDRVWVEPDVVIVTAIGASMRRIPGVSARIFGALGQSNINVIAIAQGSSEYSISIVVSHDDADEALQQIHTEVIVNGQ